MTTTLHDSTPLPRLVQPLNDLAEMGGLIIHDCTNQETYADGTIASIYQDGSCIVIVVHGRTNNTAP